MAALNFSSVDMFVVVVGGEQERKTSDAHINLKKKKTKKNDREKRGAT